MTAATLPPDIYSDSVFTVIGLGGMGGVAARYLAVFLASIGRPIRLCLVDGDAFEPGNDARMVFTRYGNKAAVLRDELLERFSDSALTIVAIEEFVTAENARRLIGEGDVVLLAVDNHATRKLVSDRCAEMDAVCLISGGNDGVGPDATGAVLRGTYGNAQLYIREGGRDLTPSLGAYHPEIAIPADHIPTERDCTELAASVPQILFANLTGAAALLNTLWLYLCGVVRYNEICFDIADGLMRPLPLLPAVPRSAPRTAAIGGEVDALAQADGVP